MGSYSEGANNYSAFKNNLMGSSSSKNTFFNRKFGESLPYVSHNDIMNDLSNFHKDNHNCIELKIFVQTKFKVKVDVGLLQISFPIHYPFN
jgi:hypothetical protein